MDKVSRFRHDRTGKLRDAAAAYRNHMKNRTISMMFSSFLSVGVDAPDSAPWSGGGCH
jgi:hypothetical protein